MICRCFSFSQRIYIHISQSYDKTSKYRNVKRDYVVALEKRALDYYNAKDN